MRLEVGPAETTAIPGTPIAIVAHVFNTDDVINAYAVRVFGVDPTWVQLERERLSLFPSAAGVVTVLVDVPPDYPAGVLRLGIEVTPVVAPTERQVGEVTILISPRRVATMRADPITVLTGRTGSFNLMLANEGNTPFAVELSATDPEAKVRAQFSSPSVTLVPGEQIIIPVRAQARPPILGAPAPRLITFKATGADNPLEAMVSFVQKPVLGRGLMSMFGLLMGITVFAIVITTTLGRVVDVSKVDAALLKRAVEGAPDNRGIPDDPGGISGRVALLTSGAGVAGATVELFSVDDPSKPVSSAATAEDGTFLLANLNEGTFKVRFRGAGFVELWYDGGLTVDDATEVDVALGVVTEGIDMSIGGVPGSIAGTVVAADAADATVTLQIPQEVLGASSDAQVQQVAVAADGAFLLEDVPAPSSYELVVAKPGFTTVRRAVNLAAGEAQEGVEIRLRRGDGLIGGVISDANGDPLGGVIVTASNTIEETSTTSLTTGTVGGFNIRNLPTPATYTIAFTKEGYATENLTVSLAEAEEFTGLDVVLEAGTGSLSGEVRIGGDPVGGITVTVTNSQTTVTTETLSTGLVGSYIVSGLPVPGTYTVTFSGAGVASQVRSVDLDPLSGINLDEVNATLTAATAVVHGTVTDPDGPASGVAIELSDGTTIFTSTSADEPEGEYVLAGVPPGTYTLTFSQTGAVPRSVLLTLTAGEDRTVDVELDPQASISGTVRRTVEGGSSQPLAGAQVLVYLVDEFPTTVSATVLTDSSGEYTITDLAAPEEYVVEFAYPEGALPQQSVRVTLGPGEERTGVNGLLTLAGSTE